jgi:transcriptional regulator with XRE-family HTH domain
MALARALGERRRAQGWTQAEVAESAGLRLDTLRTLEQGKSANPGVFYIVDLARALGVTVEDLTE